MPRLLPALALALIASPAFAQPGPPPDRRDPGSVIDGTLERLLTLDANSDEALTKTELTDERLHPLFERADANQDGTASREELRDLLARESAALGAGGRRPMGPPPQSRPQRREGGEGD